MVMEICACHSVHLHSKLAIVRSLACTMGGMLIHCYPCYHNSKFGVVHAPYMLLVPVCSTLIFLVCATFSCSTCSESLCGFKKDLQLTCSMK